MQYWRWPFSSLSARLHFPWWWLATSSWTGLRFQSGAWKRFCSKSPKANSNAWCYGIGATLGPLIATAMVGMLWSRYHILSLASTGWSFWHYEADAPRLGVGQRIPFSLGTPSQAAGND